MTTFRSLLWLGVLAATTTVSAQPPASQTPLQVLTDGFSQSPQFSQVNLIGAPVLNGAVTLVGTRPSDLAPETIEQEAARLLEDARNTGTLGSSVPNGPIRVQADRLRSLDPSNPLDAVRAINEFGGDLANEADGEVLVVEGYDPKTKTVMLAGRMSSEDDFDQVTDRLTNLAAVDNVDTSGILAGLDKPQTPMAMNPYNAISSGDANGLLNYTTLQIGVGQGTARTWAFRGIAHLWRGEYAKAASSIQIADSLSPNAPVPLPEDFQGPLRSYYEALRRQGPVSAVALTTPQEMGVYKISPITPTAPVVAPTYVIYPEMTGSPYYVGYPWSSPVLHPTYISPPMLLYP